MRSLTFSILGMMVLSHISRKTAVVRHNSSWLSWFHPQQVHAFSPSSSSSKSRMLFHRHVAIRPTLIRPSLLPQQNYHQGMTTFLMSTTTTIDNTDEEDKTVVDKPLFSIPRKFVAKPFQYHEEVTIRIDSLTNMGWGVGRIQLEDDEGRKKDIEQEDNDGSTTTTTKDNNIKKKKWVVMVPHVVVDELVRVRIFRNMKNYSEADLIEVIESSPNRVEPKCSLAGICGGCQYQHMSITAQRDWKTLHVQEVLQQQTISGYTTTTTTEDNDDGENNDVTTVISTILSPTIGTDEVFGYRSKLTPHYQAPIEIEPGKYEMQEIGFQKSSNRQLVDVPECPIATDAINIAYKETRIKLQEQARQGLLNNLKPKKKKKKRRGSKSGDLGATLLFRHADDDIENGTSVVVTDHNEYMTTTINGIQFRYLAGNFFQNNNYVVPLMVNSVLDAATKPSSKTGKSLNYLIDCYCGSGLFALSAATKFNVCVGIELNERAIEEATANAVQNGITNCHFVAASAEAIFTSPPTVPVVRGGGEEKDNNNDEEEAAQEQQQFLKVSDFPRDETVVVLDPPRKGCSPEFLEQLYEYSPQRIVYMSCGPATQARDAKGIVEIGGYDIISIQPFDLFPQTKHIECLMVFEKKETK